MTTDTAGDALRSPRVEALIALIHSMGVPYGREDSFKLMPGRVCAERVLLGVPLAGLPRERIDYLCHAVGLPRALRDAFERGLPTANMLLFAVEDETTVCTSKVYLEFWDSVCREVQRTQRRDPLLLNIGFKWRSDSEGSDARLAHYVCRPMLSAPEILARIDVLLSGAAAALVREPVCNAVARASAFRPEALLLYAEVHEAEGVRRSFDLNLYKTGLPTAALTHELQALADALTLPRAAIRACLRRLGGCPMGHLSAGLDRSGVPFVTVYAEVRALDA